MKALPVGNTELVRRNIAHNGGYRWTPFFELVPYLADRTLKLCFCGHPDCIEGPDNPNPRNP